MAVVAMQVIAQWSEIDSLVTAAVVSMLGGNARPAIAMVLALTSTQAQVAALEAAAKTILSGNSSDLFEASLAVIRKAAKRRHRLAHWIWAYSDELPGFLLLIDPKEETLFHVGQLEEVAAFVGLPINSLYWVQEEGVWVYSQQDLQDIYMDAQSIKAVVRHICFMVSDLGLTSETARHLLLSEPRILKQLERMGRSPPPTPEPPP